MAALLAFTFATGDGWLPIVAVVAVVGIASAVATSRLQGPGDVDGDGYYGARTRWPRSCVCPCCAASRIAQLVFGGRHGGRPGPHRDGPGGPPRTSPSGHRPGGSHGLAGDDD